jgi:subtilisin family serine protease
MWGGNRHTAAAVLLVLFAIGPARADDGIANLKSAPAAARSLAAKAEQGGARVIVTLAAPATPKAAPTGAMPLEEYIDSLQTQALQSLGWVNFNDIVRYEYSPAMAMTVDAGRLRQLMDSGNIAGVFEDTMNQAFLADSVPLIGGPASRAGGAGGKGVSVAVLDTGIDASHPFLQGRVVAEACFSSTGMQGQAKLKSTCPGGATSEVGRGAARPCATGDCSHGTHVAGIIAGKGANFTGVAPEAGLIGVQVFTMYDLPDGRTALGGATSDVIRGLEWVYSVRDTHKVAAVNMSLGGGQFKQVCDKEGQPYAPILKLLHDAGIAVVVASGNEGFTDSLAAPACLSQSISVGAIDKEDRVARFSNSASFLTLLAPGIDIAVGDLGGRGINSSVPGGAFARMPGTSMAAPHVAGAFAALKSAMPGASVDQLVDILKRGGKQVRDPRNGVSVPRIQVDKALALNPGRNPGQSGAEPPPRSAPPVADAAPEPERPKPTPTRESKPRPPAKSIPERGGNDDGIGKW